MNIKACLSSIKSQYTNDFIFELEPNEAASFQDQGIDGSFSLYIIDLHKLYCIVGLNTVCFSIDYSMICHTAYCILYTICPKPRISQNVMDWN